VWGANIDEFADIWLVFLIGKFCTEYTAKRVLISESNTEAILLLVEAVAANWRFKITKIVVC